MARSHKGLSKPPEGVIRGENVPPGSEPDEYDRERLERVKHTLKGESETFMEMSDSELEEAAKRFIDKYMED